MSGMFGEFGLFGHDFPIFNIDFDVDIDCLNDILSADLTERDGNEAKQCAELDQALYEQTQVRTKNEQDLVDAQDLFEVRPMRMYERMADQQVETLSSKQSKTLNNELSWPSNTQGQDIVYAAKAATPKSIDANMAAEDAASVAPALGQAQHQQEMAASHVMPAQSNVAAAPQQAQQQFNAPAQINMSVQISMPAQINNKPAQINMPYQINNTPAQINMPNQIILPSIPAHHSLFVVQPQFPQPIHAFMAILEDLAPGNHLRGLSLNSRDLDVYFSTKTVLLERLHPIWPNGTSKVIGSPFRDRFMPKVHIAVYLRGIEQKSVSHCAKYLGNGEAWVKHLIDRAEFLEAHLEVRGFEISIRDAWDLALDLEIAKHMIAAVEGELAHHAFCNFYDTLLAEKSGCDLANGLIWIMNQANRSARRDLTIPVAQTPMCPEVMGAFQPATEAPAPYIKSAYLEDGAPLVLTRSLIPVFLYTAEYNSGPARREPVIAYQN